MFNEVDCTKVPLSKHRIAQIHEPTGRYSNCNSNFLSLTDIPRGNLYIGSYNHHIEGLPVEEGRQITDDLMAHVTKDKYKFSLHWEDPGVSYTHQYPGSATNFPRILRSGTTQLFCTERQLASTALNIEGR